MIPLAKPYIDDEDINEVLQVIKSGRLSLGPKLEEFEAKFAEYIGTKYAIAVSSGTAGLHLCIKSLNLKESDEVITTPFSFIASSNCILFEKAKPVFVDIDPKTFNINPKKIEAAITNKTKAILPVHIFGEACDMKKIIKIASKYNLPIIEDACESIGTEYKGKKVGSFGIASVFAFYANKQITTGEGGMICTNSKELSDLFKSLRNQGRKDMAFLEHDKIGYNYRLTDICCSLGITQLKKINFILKEREKIAKKYNDTLKKIKDIKLPKLTKNKSWFVYVIALNEKYNREKVMSELEKKGISTRPYLPSIHLQKAYKDLFNYKEGSFPISENVSNTSIALPFFVGLKDEEIKYIKESLSQILENEELLSK